MKSVGTLDAATGPVHPNLRESIIREARATTNTNGFAVTLLKAKIVKEVKAILHIQARILHHTRRFLRKANTAKARKWENLRNKGKVETKRKKEMKLLLARRLKGVEV